MYFSSCRQSCHPFHPAYSCPRERPKMSRTLPTVFSPINIHCMLHLTTDYLYFCFLPTNLNSPVPSSLLSFPNLPSPAILCTHFQWFCPFLPTFYVWATFFTIVWYKHSYYKKDSWSLEALWELFLPDPPHGQPGWNVPLHAALGDCKHHKYNTALLFNQTRQPNSVIWHTTYYLCKWHLKPKKN